ncbi:F0F1 ATP synthase subunit epsilon [Fischerella thermalis CCMEE 5330]|uniref:F0F1 ATP synthase subunit epsilon n=1 Tax=Fischerella thermalis CCMEE 5330 TaxID=2019670 RepID=A0A2N6MI05_9CYAN|nr:F0F1 ATP synthase subunit epsilon [Fischerella thermalis]PMB46375.1 F0F1 ATP synthase subunit epsilon [Fischerella thermalis CCMEE 5330]
MHLKLLLPTEILIDQAVTKVTAEAENGSFCLLPNHIDFVTALVPGILSFESQTGAEFFLAVDEGVLVKQGAIVQVSVRNAVRGENLESLQQQVQQQFRQLDKREQQARSVLARLETSFVREFMELGGKP